MNNPIVSIIVPTRNSSSTLEALLCSVKEQTYKNIEIIIVDQSSSDTTLEIAKLFLTEVVTLPASKFYTPPTKSRNVGAQHAKGSILYHLDSDMEISRELIKEVVEKFKTNKNLGALVVHEVDLTKGFWSKAKALERKCYWGNQNIESARIVKTDIFEKVGGYDENISSGEDFDIHRRYKEITAIGFCEEVVYHNLGQLNFFRLVKKKYFYGKTAVRYLKKHSESGVSLVKDQLVCFIYNYKLFLASPLIGFGTIVLKISELIFAGFGIISEKIGRNYLKFKSLIKVLFKIKNPFALRYNLKIFKGKYNKITLNNHLTFKIRGGESDIKEIVKINLLEEYPKEFFKNINPKGVVLDIGAHIGSFSLMMNKLFPKVKIYSIEPMADNYDLLIENIKINDAENNIIPIKIGVSNYDGIGSFEIFEDMDSGHLVTNKDKNKNIKEKVEIVRMKSLFEKLNIEEVDVIKIDIEGEEYKILPDMIEIFKKIKNITLEYHQILNNKMVFPCGDKNITHTLTNAGFKQIYKTKNIMIWEKI